MSCDALARATARSAATSRAFARSMINAAFRAPMSSGKVSRAESMDSRESQIARFVTAQNGQGHIFFVVSAGTTGPPGQLRIPPVNPFQHIGHLSWRDRHRAIRRGGPDELSTVQALCIKRQPDPVMPEDLGQ